MKLDDIIIQNFATVSYISVSFDKNLTYIIGENGSGKTTTGLNAVWFLLKGLAQKGENVLIAERFRFIGPHGKSATVIGNIHDEVEGVKYKITRKLLKNKTELKIEASDGRQLDQAWLDSIFNAFLIDPVGFSRLSGKQQALAFGADTASFDVKKKELYQERRDIGRDVERLKGVVETAGNPEKVEMVDIAELMTELDLRRQTNRNRNHAIEDLEKKDKHITESELNIETIKADIEALRIRLVKAETDLERDGEIRHDKGSEVQLLQPANEQEIKEKVESSQKINLAATAYKDFLENQSSLSDEIDCYEGKTDEIRENEKGRTKYLQTLDLPWPNISINDEGEFRLNDKPFASPYFSTGEILKFGARIGSKLKGGLKYVYFPNSQQLDEKNREAVFKVLNDDGYQIVCEFVDTKKIEGENCILLKELKVIESEDAGLK